METNPNFDVVTPEWIRQRLMQTGVSQKKLAEGISTNPQRLSEWMNGKRMMTGPTRAAIWYYFKSLEG